ncbi:probable tubulin polyglutamylase ttll-15 [Teleopsis dalmanni]|uniref:probable tubulin polyglutamylase ttll-15 n=1 Tax=Teleopsis dalmanni TaxID=139649 RepID=UPI0018CC8CB0|nr:probable tubulin polyglutamylase ttll-15 [Teleopsis dalmanni]
MPRFSDSEDADEEFYSYQAYCHNRRRTLMSKRFVVFFLCATLASAVVVEFLPFKILNSNVSLRSLIKKTTDLQFGKQPTYAIYSNSPKEDHLVHVKNVLSYLGYRRVPFEDDWDLLWAHDYPYLRLPERMKNLEPHQTVNHLPGCGFLTNKVDLCTTPLPFLPRAFRLPSEQEEFLKYAMNNLGALFVEKNNQHRLIAIRSPNEINLDSNDSFVQEYIQNPFLVNGYKFDIGAYVVITSVNPLRAYIYKGDILFRYCPVKYYPFDPSIVDKYVVGDDYLPTWEVPSLKKYYIRYSGSMRAAFDAYVRDQSLDPSGIWTQVEDIIRRTIISKEQDIARLLRSYKTQNFFELMRFDLIIDKDLKVILMEANMSPNLSSAHFKPNSLLYEQILYSALNLVGIGSPIKHKTKDRYERWNLE